MGWCRIELDQATRERLARDNPKALQALDRMNADADRLDPLTRYSGQTDEDLERHDIFERTEGRENA